MSTIIASTPLTREQVKAIKEATTVVFRHGAGGGVMELTKETKDKTYGTPYEVRLEIPVTSVIVGKTAPMKEAVAVLTSAQYNNVWRSVASLLKPDDKIKLEFQADYWRPHEGYEDIHLDTLIFKIDRKNAYLDFMIEVSVCRDGYQFRMVK